MNTSNMTQKEKEEIIDFLKENLIRLLKCSNTHMWLYYKDEIIDNIIPQNVCDNSEYTTVPKLTYTTNKDIIDKHKKETWESQLEQKVTVNITFRPGDEEVIINFLKGL